MFKNYLKISIRHLLRHRLYALLNLGSLAIGLACFIWIWLYVKDEWKYDQYPQQNQSIYRVVSDFETSQGTNYHATSAPLWGPYLQQDYPQIAKVVRIRAIGQKMMVSHAKNQFYEARWAFADADFFQMFSLPLLKGDPTNVLRKRHQVVITQAMAQKYFGGGSPVGKKMTLDNRQVFTVSGVMADIPQQSHFHFDFVASFSSTPQFYGDNFIKHKRNLWVHTYVQLLPEAAPDKLEAQLPAFIQKYVGDQTHNGFRLTTHLQPLTSIHLNSHREQEIEANGQKSAVYILFVIGIFVLLIAMTNYINLATAQATHRAKEVGISKVVGAYRNQIMGQFLAESLILIFLALLLACALLEISLPFLNQMAGKALVVSKFVRLDFVLEIAGLTCIIGLLAGSYPALILARFEPVKALKGKVMCGSQGARLRTGLIVTQFVVSIGLIVATQVVYKQLHFLQNKSLGFNQEQTVWIEFPNETARKHYNAYKQEILKNPAVVKVSGTSDAPGVSVNEHVFRLIGQGISQDRVVHRAFIDYDYFQILDVPLIAGRAFSRKFPKDTLPEKQGSTIIINQTAVKAFGWKSAEDAIGKKMRRVELAKSNFTIIGVVKDFHTQSLHQAIQPTLFNYAPARRQSHLLVKYRADNTQSLLKTLQNQWQKLLPAYGFSYTFADQRFAKLYKAETHLGQLMTCFAMLTIIVAGLGIFGLSAYLANQRQKEMSIRKILGANIPQLWYEFSRSFVRLILLACVIAFPLAYFFTQNWLQNFAYKTSLSLWEFALAGITTLIIALLTISFHTLAIAKANPTIVLRNE